jgi:hypothetical protein
LIPANGGGPRQGVAGALPTASAAGATDVVVVVGAVVSTDLELAGAVDAASGAVVELTELGGWPARPTPTAVADPARVIETAATAAAENRRGRTVATRARWEVATGRATSISPRRCSRWRR